MRDCLKSHWPIVVICLLAALIMFPQLNRPYFWQDEAETALLARSILRASVPTAWDGQNLITQLSGNDSNSNLVWSFTPWLPFYIVAASFKVLGESTFSGRLPFVIIGILGLISLYLFAYQLSRNRHVALLSSLFLLLNMQFILYSRQCKYYSILFFIPPLLYFAYSRLRKDVTSFLLFIVCCVLLFYSNYISLFTSIVGITIYTLFVKRDRKEIFTFLAAGAISLLLTIPFFFIGDFWTSSGLISRLPSVAEYADKFARHIWYFNNLAFALVLFVPLRIFYRRQLYTKDEMRLIKLLLWIIIPAWLTLPLFNQDVFRYNLQLIPLFCLLSAFVIIAFFRWSKVAGTIFLLLFLATNIFSNFPAILFQTGLKTFGVKLEEKTEWVTKKFNKDEDKTREYFQKNG